MTMECGKIQERLGMSRSGDCPRVRVDARNGAVVRGCVQGFLGIAIRWAFHREREWPGTIGCFSGGSKAISTVSRRWSCAGLRGARDLAFEGTHIRFGHQKVRRTWGDRSFGQEAFEIYRESRVEDQRCASASRVGTRCLIWCAFGIQRGHSDTTV